MKAMRAVLCLFGAAAGCWLGVMEVVLRHAAFEQRVVVAAFIVAQSGLTLIVVSGSTNRISRMITAAGACALLVLGSLAVLENIDGVHFEGFAVVIGIALVAQALLTLSTAAGDWKPAPITSPR